MQRISFPTAARLLAKHPKLKVEAERGRIHFALGSGAPDYFDSASQFFQRDNGDIEVHDDHTGIYRYITPTDLLLNPPTPLPPNESAH